MKRVAPDVQEHLVKFGSWLGAASSCEFLTNNLSAVQINDVRTKLSELKFGVALLAKLLRSYSTLGYQIFGGCWHVQIPH